MNALFKLLAIDLDGTLLRSDGTLSSATVAAVQQAQAAGVTVVIASARPPRSIRPIHDILGLTTPVIAYNGALIHDYARGPLYQRALTANLALLAATHLRDVDPDANRYIECGDQWYADALDEGVLQTSSGRLGLLPDGYGGIDTILAAGALPIYKMVSLLARPLARSLLANLRRAAPRRFSFDWFEKRTAAGSALEVELRTARCNKGDAVRFLQQHLGIRKEHTAAIGDGRNDVPMLRAARFGVAMGHAPRAVKSAADWITSTHNADGVAQAINGRILAP